MTVFPPWSHHESEIGGNRNHLEASPIGEHLRDPSAHLELKRGGEGRPQRDKSALVGLQTEASGAGNHLEASVQGDKGSALLKRSTNIVRRRSDNPIG